MYARLDIRTEEVTKLIEKNDGLIKNIQNSPSDALQGPESKMKKLLVLSTIIGLIELTPSPRSSISLPCFILT